MLAVHPSVVRNEACCVRLLSYNIHKGIGGRDRRYRLERVIEAIEAERPDLILLQEVTHNAPLSHCHDQPGLLAAYFRAEAWAFQLNVQWQQGGYGNLILSRWPFASRHQISLRLNRKKPRGAQVVVVETDHGPLQVVNWHLGLSEAERHFQTHRLLHHPTFRQSAELPALVVGDSNDWRNTLATGALEAHGFHQATAPPSRYRTFPAYVPMGSLDKAYYRGGVRIREVSVVRNRLTREASDHLPLVVDFSLR